MDAEEMPAGTITALSPQETSTQRVSIFIDGTFALGVGLDALIREDLYVGKYVDEAQWSRLEATEQANRAFHSALRYLQVRPRSTAEVRERLQRKQFAPLAIEQAIERLRALDMLDDMDFARRWIESRNAHRPRGRSMLAEELRRKGIARDVIETVLQDAELLGNEQEQARKVAYAALPKYASIGNRETFQRLLGGYLQRRGFNYETIKPLIKTLWLEIQPSNDTEESEADTPPPQSCA
jgi:regulatory protein